MSNSPKIKLAGQPATPKPAPAPAPTRKDAETASSQFGENQVETSWLRRAVSAGMRYTKTESEHSGVHIVPILDLELMNANGAAPKPGPDSKAKDPPGAPGEKGAFAPEEGQLFGTAINSFLENEEVRKKAKAKSVQFRDSGTLYEQSDSASTMKRLIVIAVVALIGFGIYRIFTAKNITQGRKQHFNASIEDDLESIKATDKTPVKSRGQAAPKSNGPKGAPKGEAKGRP